MTIVAANKLNQSKDIAGSRQQSSSLDVTEESLKLGAPIPGQSGSSVIISGVAPDLIITGLTGLTSASVCNYITLSGADTASNNGTFQITEVINSTSAIITNNSGVGADANNGSIEWVERKSYSLEDDLNYARSDRSNIKGIDYDQAVPTYVRCTDQTAQIPASLANIAGKTTDAKAFVDNLKFQTVSVSPGDTYITLTSAGDLKHANSVDVTGVPVDDGYDAGNDEATFVAILDDDGYATELTVLADQAGGAEQGWRIYGRTRSGGSISPNSVEIEFRAFPLGFNLSASVPYTWESGQPSSIDVIIGYRTCFSTFSEVAFRKLLLFGIVYGGASSGGSGTSLPLPTEYGQFLFAQDATQFIAAVPVVNDEGLIMVDENGKVVVVGI